MITIGCTLGQFIRLSFPRSSVDVENIVSSDEIPDEFTSKAQGRYFYYFSSPYILHRHPPENPFIKRNQRSGKYPAERTTACIYMYRYIEYDFSKGGQWNWSGISPFHHFSFHFPRCVLKFNNIIYIDMCDWHFQRFKSETSIFNRDFLLENKIHLQKLSARSLLILLTMRASTRLVYQ